MTGVHRRSLYALVSLSTILLLLVACGSGGDQSPTPVPATATPDPLPHGSALAKPDIDELAELFLDNPLMGGQVAPRVYKWVSEDVAVFLQFDKPKLTEATALRYFGISMKGVFCSEARPDRAFTQFDRLNAATYGQGTPSAGERGYWLAAVAVDSFVNERGRQVKSGTDYEFATMTAPSCGANVPAVDFAAPGARKISTDELAKFAALFDDMILDGGQVAPRLYKWVNTDNALFVQFNSGNPSQQNPAFNPAAATSLRFIGLAARGEFCKSNRPSEEFPHFHRYTAPLYAEGHGGPPRTKGIWLFWVATESFERQANTIQPGIDRTNSIMPVEESC